MESKQNLLSLGSQDGFLRPIPLNVATAAMEGDRCFTQPQDDFEAVDVADLTAIQAQERKVKRKLKLFVGCVCLASLLIRANQVARYGLLFDLERQFELSAILLGVIVSSYETGHVVCLPLFYGCSKLHKARLCLFGCLLGVLSSILWTIPNFLDKWGLLRTKTPIPCYGDNSTVLLLNSCSPVNATARSGAESFEEAPPHLIAFLMTSQALLGASAAPFTSTAVSYVEQSGDPAFTATAASVLVLVTSVGPVLGYLLAAACTAASQSGGPSGNDADASFAIWWVGPAVLGLPLLVLSVTFMAFPRQMATPSQVENITLSASRRSSYCSLHSRVDAPASALNLSTRRESLMMTPYRSRSVSNVSHVSLPKDVLEHCQDSAKAGGGGTSLVFVCGLLAACCLQYLPAGVCPFLVKYLQTQYMVTGMEANVISAMCFGLAGAVATCSGGYAAASLELKPTTLARFVLLGLFLALVCFASAMFIGCPQLESMWTSSASKSVDLSIQWLPECNLTRVLPPCAVTCKYRLDTTDHLSCDRCLQFFTPVSPPGELNMTLRAEEMAWCAPVCINLLPYITILFLCVFFTTVTGPPLLGVVARCVNERRRSLALSVQTATNSFLALIPAPLIYGVLIDKAQIWPGEGSGKFQGEKLYNNSVMRLSFHGVVAGFLTLATVLVCCVFLKLRRMEFASLRKNRLEPECPIEIRLEDMTLLDPSCTMTHSQSILTLNTQQ